jgi:hypothetical protein
MGWGPVLAILLSFIFRRVREPPFPLFRPSLRKKNIFATFRRSCAKCERIVREVHARDVLSSSTRRSSMLHRRCPDICEVVPAAGAARLTSAEIQKYIFPREIHREIGNCVKCKSYGKISRRWEYSREYQERERERGSVYFLTNVKGGCKIKVQHGEGDRVTAENYI